MLSYEELLADAEANAAEGFCPEQDGQQAAEQASAAQPTLEEIRCATRSLLDSRNLYELSIKDFKAELYAQLGCDPADRREEIHAIIQETVAELLNASHCRNKASAAHTESHELGEEDRRTSKQVYLVTFARPLVVAADNGTLLQKPEAYSREQIAQALVRSFMEAQGQKANAITFVVISVFLERHEDGEVHYHAAVKASGNFRFLGVKAKLLELFGLASHWSTKQLGYAAAVAYCYIPSPSKALQELDPAPFLWAADGAHPPLWEASRAPVNAGAMMALKEQGRRKAAEAGKAEPRFLEADVWPVVVQQNIVPSAHAREDLVAFAKRSGGAAMLKFCYTHWDKLPELIQRAWLMENVEAHVELSRCSRLDILQAACDSPCACHGRWKPAAAQLLLNNGIPAQEWATAMLHSLRRGREKGSLITHAGREGDEGKSFLLAPLRTVYGGENVFESPPRSGFPLLGLERARIVVLDDWRFKEDVIPYNLQLLWFEGKPFIISRPQNQHSGHLRYEGDAPVFITTLESDLVALKEGLQAGDIQMMLKRLKIFGFTRKLVNPDRTIPACGRCFAEFLWQHQKPDETLNMLPVRDVVPIDAPNLGGSSSSSSNQPSKRLPLDPTGSTPEAKRRLHCSWTLEEVIQFLHTIGLGHVEAAFRTNAVDGQFLSELSAEELQSELGLTVLQVKKLLTRLP